jgi:hypothetical protein
LFPTSLKKTNCYGKSVLAFWTVYCPARCCTGSSSSETVQGSL